MISMGNSVEQDRVSLFITMQRKMKMTRLSPLFSGSDGNCYYIGSAEKGILIDCGRSAKQITSALSGIGIEMKNISAIFVTHEHVDHVKGLKTLASKYHIKVFATEGTIQEMNVKGLINGNVDIFPVSYGGMAWNDMEIKPFRISHDCREGVGYVITTSDGRKTAFATDTGIVTDEIKTALKGCDTVVIESNYDENMLLSGDYPYSLKRRILSSRGHISNEVCAETVSELVETGTTRIILAHLSRKNNMPCLAEEASVSRLTLGSMKRNSDYILHVAEHENNSLKIVY